METRKILRVSTRQRTDKHSGNFPESSKGDSRDKLGAYLGKSGRTIDKQLAVIEAAEAATSAW